MIKNKQEYDSILQSGMFFEFHPELSGEWEKDKTHVLDCIYIDFMTTPKEGGWTIMRSFNEFRNWVVENKKVPDLLCLDFELSESAYRWTLDGANEGVKFPYENQGIETTMKCLVFVWNVCNQNSLTMPEVWIKTDYPQGRYDLGHFLELTAKQKGEVANFKFMEMEITENYVNEPNYKIYQKVETEISSNYMINDDIVE